jgi:AbrB family looped-hinge helix DNA binding protein
MKSTIDPAGRIVVPKPIREAAGLTPGTPLSIRLVQGHVEIEPLAAPVKLERRGHLLVAVPRDRRPPLTVAAVESVTGRLRRERGESERRGRGKDPDPS